MNLTAFIGNVFKFRYNQLHYFTLQSIILYSQISILQLNKSEQLLIQQLLLSLAIYLPQTLPPLQFQSSTKLFILVINCLQSIKSTCKYLSQIIFTSSQLLHPSNKQITDSYMHNNSFNSFSSSQNNKSFQHHLDTDFKNSAEIIQRNLNERKRMLDGLRIKIDSNSNLYLSTNRKNQIINECNKYAKLAPLFKQVKQYNKKPDKLSKFEQFWAENQKLERQLEEELRSLKQIDIRIDNIVNEEFDKCNEIDEIQETIRTILSKKDPDHIRKAEPLNQEKKKCIDFLQIKGNEKNRVKEAKYELVIRILERLNALKKHRENGLNLCESHVIQNKHKISEKELKTLLKDSSQALKQINKSSQNTHLMKQQQLKMLQNVELIQTEINELSKKMLTFINKQNELCFELERLWKMRNESQFFKNVFCEAIGMEDIADSGSNSAFNSIITGLEKYEKQESQKQTNILKIRQGIQVTSNTVTIFQHILQKIKTENLRRKQLLENISQIQEKHNEQRTIREVIAEIETEVDKLQLRKNRLQKHLSEKVDEANVTAYKDIHQEIESLNKQIKAKEKQENTLRNTIGENAKVLYDETLWLQEQYSDILSEVVPNYWFRDSDFTKEQAIKDLNMYLMKTFKRLSIAD